MAKFGRNGAGPAPQEKPGALQRVEALEQGLEGTLRAMRQTFALVEQRLANLEQVQVALIKLVGQEQIEAELRRMKIEQLEEDALKEKFACEEAIKEGRLLEATEVTELSVIVGSEVNADGTPLYPSRVQFLYPKLHKEYQDIVLGKKVGDVVTTPPGSKFTIKEIYVINKDWKPAPADVQALVVASEQAGLPPSEPLTPEAEEQLLEELAAEAGGNDQAAN